MKCKKCGAELANGVLFAGSAERKLNLKRSFAMNVERNLRTG